MTEKIPNKQKITIAVKLKYGRNFISILCLFAFITFLLLNPLVIASSDSYKPYLHKPSVPDYPKIKLYGSYETNIFPGAATYLYPIEVPMGTNGLTPSISIGYSSQTVKQRSGVMGAGWGLTQSYIYRDINSTPNNVSDDSFKMILGGTSYDMIFVPEDGFYHTKIESFIRIQNLSGASNTYKSYWLVTLRDGTKYRFGYNFDSEMTSNMGKNYTLKWSLDQVEDTHSNKIFYSYLENPKSEDTGTVYLSKIEYNNDKKRKIDFLYESSVRPDIRTTYEQGNMLTESRRLVGIAVYANGKLVRRYSFEYVLLNPEKSLTSISSIKYFGSDNTSMLHSITFEYGSSNAGYTKYDSKWLSPTALSYNEYDLGARFVDLNRDGFVDIVKATQSTNENKVWINDKNGGWIDSSSTWSLPTWIINTKTDNGVAFIDFNNDGFVDILQGIDGVRKAWQNNGNGWTDVSSKWAPAIDFFSDNKSQSVQLVDFNGDGRVDMLQAIEKNGTLSNKAFKNNGSGWVDISSEWKSPVAFLKNDNDTGARVEDINGDGLPDILFSNGTKKPEQGPLYNGKIAFLCRYDTCLYKYESEIIAWLRNKGWNVISKAYSNWTEGELNSYDLIACHDEERACVFTSTTPAYKVHKNNNKGIIVFSGYVNSFASYYLGYTTSYIGSHLDSPFIDIVASDAITDKYSGTVNIFNSSEKIRRISTSYLKSYVVNLANEGSSYSCLFKVNGSGKQGRFLWSGFFYGTDPYYLRKDGEIITLRSLNWVQCGNADGCNVSNSTQPQLIKAWLNTGSGWVDAPSWYPPQTPSFLATGNSDGGVRFLDLNGDGLTDILEDYANGSEIYRSAWINNGHGWTNNSEWKSSEPFTKDGKNTGVRLVDINGDGLADVVIASTGSSGSNTWSWLKNNNAPFLLKKVTNELGGVTYISYQPSTGFNNNGNDSLSDLGFNVWIVKNDTNDNSMTNDFKLSSIASYEYSGGSYDYQDFEFRGFGKVKENLPDSIYVNHYFHQDKERKGIEYKNELYSYDNKPFSKTEFIFNVTNKSGCSIVLLDSQTNYIYDGYPDNPNTTKVSYSYDSFGNLIQKFLHGNINVQGDEKIEKYKYAVNNNSWIVNKISLHQLFSSNNVRVMDVMYYYDTSTSGDIIKGDVIQVEAWLSSSTGGNQITKYSYDNYGNLISIIDTLGRTSTYSFGLRDKTFTYPDYFRNALIQRIDYMYDLGTGNLLWSKEESRTTNFYYDVFGRFLKKVGPLDSVDYPSKVYTYILDGKTPEVIKITSFASTNKSYESYYFYDGFANLIQIKSPAENNQQIVNNLFYDNLSRVKKIQNPYFDSSSTNLGTPSTTVSSTNYNYDALGRVVSVINTDGTTNSVNFNHETITTYDENNHKKVYVTDAYGIIVKVLEYVDSNPYITYYTYDTADNLIKIVDNAGNIYSFEYDSLGRRIYLSDPDSGNWSFQYDLVGNLIAQKQLGAGNLVSGDGYYREYDSLNNLIRIRNGSTSTSPLIESYTYDSFGQRIKTKKNDSANTVIYTPFKELMRIVNKTGTYDYSYIYQGGSLVARVNPDGSKYYYHQDNLGSTSLITDAYSNVVEKTFYSPFGEVIDGGSNENRLYTGYYKDSACQYYAGARYYNPCLGFFIQPDDLTLLYNPQSLNHYSYAANSPYLYVDKSGKLAWLALVVYAVAYGSDFIIGAMEAASSPEFTGMVAVDYGLSNGKGMGDSLVSYGRTFAYAGTSSVVLKDFVYPAASKTGSYIEKTFTKPYTGYSVDPNWFDDYYGRVGIKEPEFTIDTAVHISPVHTGPFYSPNYAGDIEKHGTSYLSLVTDPKSSFTEGIDTGEAFTKEVYSKASVAVVQGNGNVLLIANLGKSVSNTGSPYGAVVSNSKTCVAVSQYPFDTPVPKISSPSTSLLDKVVNIGKSVWNSITGFFKW